jgi:uncharacterized protein YbjT (DUF2867 family)
MATTAHPSPRQGILEGGTAKETAPQMHILVLGATGFVGSAVCARLASRGNKVTGLARHVPAVSLYASRLIATDISRFRTEADWLPYLADIDAVVNCAGILQDSPNDSTAGVHDRGVASLFHACVTSGIKRVIHLSAIGVDRMTPTDFSRTKLRGDQSLMALDLDWVILRPSVVVGRSAYGGSALFRGLACLSVLPKPPETGLLQIVQLDELVSTIESFLSEESPSKMVVDVAGPERLSLTDIVGHYRAWLGWKPAHIFKMPRWLSSLMYRLGDLAGFFGWHPPMRTTAGIEIKRGAIGDNSSWKAMTGIEPRSLLDSLRAEAPSVQEKWFSKLYFLKALVFSVFALFWITTGLVSFGPGWKIGMDLMREGGVEDIGPILIAAGASADILIGIGIAFRRTARIALWAAFAISVAYVIIGTILVPRLWEDPLGPMLKIWPIMVFNLVAIAMVDDR